MQAAASFFSFHCFFFEIITRSQLTSYNCIEQIHTHSSTWGNPSSSPLWNNKITKGFKAWITNPRSRSSSTSTPTSAIIFTACPWDWTSNLKQRCGRVFFEEWPWLNVQPSMKPGVSCRAALYGRGQKSRKRIEKKIFNPEPAANPLAANPWPGCRGVENVHWRVQKHSFSAKPI